MSIQEEEVQLEMLQNETINNENKTTQSASEDMLVESQQKTPVAEMLQYETINNKNKPTQLQVKNEDVDKVALWKILQETQCPLLPYKYEQDNQLVTVYYFNDEFWRKDESKDEDSCHPIIFKNDSSGKIKRKAKDDAELMLAVDKYTHDVRINKSYEIFTKLLTALHEYRDGIDDGDSSNDEYKKLMPTMMGRIMFLSVFLTTALNGYFMVISLLHSTKDVYNTPFMNNAALLMAICEVTLFANLLFGSVFSFGIALIYALCTNNSTYIQSKRIAQSLRDLSTLSILRYMPSIEIVTSFLVHWRESIAKIWTDFYLLCSTSLTLSARKNICELIFSIPCYLIETCAPVLALYAILVKIKQLDFVIDGEPFADWEYAQYLAFIAFLNQVAGLRVLRNVETASIQHFVFSGSDASLDTDELLLLDDWWNVTCLSAVSNLHLHWYDNMVFWYSLDPQKIQLLLKSHDSTIGSSDSLRQMIKDNDDILDEYDQKVIKLLQQSK